MSADDGTRLWVYDRTTPVLTLRGTSSPALVERAAIAGFDNGQVVAIALSNGQPLWEARVAVPRGATELERMVDIDADPVIDRTRTVYAVTYQGQVAALELFSGERGLAPRYVIVTPASASARKTSTSPMTPATYMGA